MVITVANTAVATAAAIVRIGARPVFVDVDPERLTMDPVHLVAVIDALAPQRPKAIIPVHLYGQPADMPAIVSIAAENGMAVVEDCAQAHGARIDGRRVGSWGQAGCFSTYPTKNLGGVGDGGMITTHNGRLAEKLRRIREYGWHERYISRTPGTNSRLDELQAAVLRVK